MLDALLSVIAPHTCLDCGAEGTLWCARCRQTAFIAPERCFRCHALSPKGRTCLTCQRSSALYSVQAATRYEAIAKQLIWRLKFERAQAAALEVAEIMAVRLPFAPDTLITHIPTSTNHVRRRGYDQAQLIAKRLAKQMHTPYRMLLLRLGQQEQHTASRVQRLAQLNQAFIAVNTDHVIGQHIILIDDVITTGATLDAAAHALRAAGAKRVSALVFAQA